MSEAAIALQGALAAFSLVGVGAAWALSYRAGRAEARARLEAQRAGELVSDAARTAENVIKETAAGIAEAHNDLVRTQVEQAQTLERLGAEIAGRSLRR